MPTTTVEITSNISRCTDKTNNGRYTMSGVYVMQSTKDNHKVYATATNGYMLAVCEYAGTTDEPVIIPHNVLPSKRSDWPSKKLKQSVLVTHDGQWESSVNAYDKTVYEGVFPDVISSLPDIDDRFQVTLNVKKLSRLCDSLRRRNGGDNTLTLFLDTTDNESTVGIVGEIGIGAIMPIKCEHEKNTKHYNEIVENYRISALK